MGFLRVIGATRKLLELRRVSRGGQPSCICALRVSIIGVCVCVEFIYWYGGTDYVFPSSYTQSGLRKSWSMRITWVHKHDEAVGILLRAPTSEPKP